jgi:hypothetical protein
VACSISELPYVFEVLLLLKGRARLVLLVPLSAARLDFWLRLVQAMPSSLFLAMY